MQVQEAQQPVLTYYVDLILHMQETLGDIRTQMYDLASLSPQYEFLRSVPGIGEVTASVFQSGKFISNNNKISKRGSPYLRKALYQAARAGISKRSNGYANKELRKFYDRLILAGKTPKVAMTATSAKLLRMIFGIMKTKTSFKF